MKWLRQKRKPPAELVAGSPHLAMAHRGFLSIAKGQWGWMDIIDEPVLRVDTSPGSMKGASLLIGNGACAPLDIRRKVGGEKYRVCLAETGGRQR